MQLCPRCGLQNPDTSRFCAQCGRPFPGAGTGRLPPQAILAGRYIIVRLLGQGGMGAVYLASDTRIAGKAWAVKEMSDAALLDPAEKMAAIRAFQTEASLLAALDHPNIPKVVDYFNEAGKHYLAMDYVPGETLETLMQMHGAPFPEKQVAQWGAQLCDVLNYLHSRQPPVIFRDLKPGNVMLQPDGTLKLIDFGIARVFKPGRSVDTTVIGTPGFAAPEQHGRTQTDARSDIYSLGVLLHHLATGYDPAATPFSLPPARQVNHQLSTQFEGVVARATALQPVSRFQTTAEMHRALTGGGAGALPTVVATPQSPYPRRSGRWSLVVLGAVTVLLLAIGIAFLAGTQRPTPAPLTLAPPIDTLQPAATPTPEPEIVDTPTAPPTNDTRKLPESTRTPLPPEPTPTLRPPEPTPTSVPALPDDAVIQRKVKETLARWSDIHDRAVRYGREDELPSILAGAALEQQIKTVRWLRDNNAYWEITRHDRRTDTWEVITPTWVRLRAWRDEKGDLYKNGVFDAKASYDDTYEARYIVEEVNGQWYVTCKGAIEAGKAEPCQTPPP